MATTATTKLLENYIAGRWTAAAEPTELLDVTNPATGETLARVPLSSRADLDAAVSAARSALPEWRVSTIARARKLFELRERLAARADEFARSVTIEMGKTLVDARAEVARMIEMVEAACAIPTTMQGRILEDVSRGIDAETVRQPVGVCAAIVPFNFPAMVPFWFLPFAIACGNTFVLKPSEQVPLTQQLVFEDLDALGLPPGVVNLVNGGREVVEGILEHPGIDAISFVGSAPVARLIYERAAKAGKRVQALGGAKNHMVVMPDAVIDHTVDGIIGSAFGAAGQRCMAGSVVVTVADAHEQLMPRLVEATKALRVGDGLDQGNDVGPVISEKARERIIGWIEHAQRVLVDGREGAPESGCFIGPTIMEVERDDPIVGEEVFGPVLAVVRADRSMRRSRSSTRAASATGPRSSRNLEPRSGATATRSRRGWLASTSGSPRRWRSSRSAAGRTASWATCTRTEPTLSSSSLARRPSPAATSRLARAPARTSSSVEGAK